MPKRATVTLIYSGPAPVIVSDAGVIAEPGQPVQIPADLAASLLSRPTWERVEKKAPAKERES